MPEQAGTSETGGALSVATDLFLAEKAEAIRAIVKHDAVKIGRHLAEARERAAHGTWIAWINAEFGMSDQTARNIINVYELSRDPKSKIILDLKLPLPIVYRLAGPKAGAVREEIVGRIARGEQISSAAVTEAFAKAKGATVEDDLKKQPGPAPLPPVPPVVNGRPAGNGGDPDEQADVHRQYHTAHGSDEPDNTDQQPATDEKAQPSATDEVEEVGAGQQPEVNDPCKLPDGSIDHQLQEFNRGVRGLCTAALCADHYEPPSNLLPEMAAEHVERLDKAAVAICALKAKLAAFAGGAGRAREAGSAGKPAKSARRKRPPPRRT